MLKSQILEKLHKKHNNLSFEDIDDLFDIFIKKMSNSLQSGNDIDGRTAVNYTMNKSIEKLAFERVSKEVAFQIRRALGR